MKQLKEFVRKFNPITSTLIALSMFLPKLWIPHYGSDPKVIITVAVYCVIGFAYGAIMQWAHGEDK